ncbi:MAG: hypothetical protein EZS28_037794 [Streblomastix strix]|uniref:Uncharacterized protein n=1 Tax=Streblomastix strix TaxID=222440 RepID=A0A5J4U8F3_9EUKA|nr:MAG: hypothetical protein EZS28_037794 [Streblomastix strix]
MLISAPSTLDYSLVRASLSAIRSLALAYQVSSQSSSSQLSISNHLNQLGIFLRIIFSSIGQDDGGLGVTVTISENEIQKQQQLKRLNEIKEAKEIEEVGKMQKDEDQNQFKIQIDRKEEFSCLESALEFLVLRIGKMLDANIRTDVSKTMSELVYLEWFMKLAYGKYGGKYIDDDEEEEDLKKGSERSDKGEKITSATSASIQWTTDTTLMIDRDCVNAQTELAVRALDSWKRIFEKKKRDVILDKVLQKIKERINWSKGIRGQEPKVIVGSQSDQY